VGECESFGKLDDVAVADSYRSHVSSLTEILKTRVRIGRHFKARAENDARTRPREVTCNAIKLIIIHNAVASILHRADCLILHTSSLPPFNFSTPHINKREYAMATPRDHLPNACLLTMKTYVLYFSSTQMASIHTPETPPMSSE